VRKAMNRVTRVDSFHDENTLDFSVSRLNDFVSSPLTTSRSSRAKYYFISLYFIRSFMYELLLWSLGEYSSGIEIFGDLNAGNLFEIENFGVARKGVGSDFVEFGDRIDSRLISWSIAIGIDIKVSGRYFKLSFFIF
jgi:hypothetical protein